MPEDCPIELKQHMIDLVRELQDIISGIPNLKTPSSKMDAARKLSDIIEEMIEFRRKYPDA